MQEAPSKGIAVPVQILVPEITPKQLQFDPDPDSGNLRTMLGKGGFGIVYAGHYQGQPVAVKSLHASNPKLTRALHLEAALMFRMTSPYTVTLHGIYAALNETALVMERMMGGSLFNLLQNDAETLPWPLRYRLAYEIAEGMWVLHQQSIVHRDLKSMNVLLDEHQHAKITDFGFSRLRGQISSVSASSQHSVGTPAYKAPEIVALDMAGGGEDEEAEDGKGSPYSPYSDIYAYGVMLWELATRKIPFAGKNPFAVFTALSQGKTEKIPVDCPPEFAALIQACWSMRPNQRPRTDEIVKQTKAMYLAAQTPVPAQLGAQPNVADDAKLLEAYVPAPWHMDPATKAALGAVQNYVRLPAGAEDMTKVVASYQRSPVPGYHIKSIEVVYSPRLNRAFGLDLDLLEARHGNAAFAPKWKTEAGPSGAWRRQTHGVLEAMAAPHQDPTHPHVMLIPMWHATKQEVLDSLFTTGFANLAEVDPGFFGKGIYSAGEAKYSYTVYGKMYPRPALLMNWVATHSAYPVIDGDMAALQAKANVGNYDAHFIPVRPQNPNDPNESVFIPCAAGGRPYQYTELVVFNPRQCLPRYVVNLESDLLPTPADIQAAELKAQAEQAQKAHAQQQAEQADKQLAAQEAAEQAQKQAEATAKEQQKAEQIAKAQDAAVQKALSEAKIKADQQAAQAKLDAEAKAAQQAEEMAKLKAKLQAAETEKAALQAASEKQALEASAKAQAEQAKKAQEAADQKIAEALQAKQLAKAQAAQAQKAAPKYVPGPGIYNPPKAGPAPVMAADIMEEKISEQEKQTFFRHIARGEQDEAEVMLQKTPSLAFAKGRFDDISDLRCLKKGDQFQRIFQDISGWQYTIWAGDIHMCQMMKRYFTQIPHAKALVQTAKSQYLEVLGGRGDFAPNQHGRQFDLTPLIDALKLYVQQRNAWSEQQRTHQWCKVIGGLQRTLPAHVINEYCRPDRSFEVNGGPPDFLDATLPRKGYMLGNQEYGLDWLLQTIYANGKMGDSWAAGRGDAAKCVALDFGTLHGFPIVYCRPDAKALDSLKARRSQQVKQLEGDLDVSMGVGLSPAPFKQ